MSKIVVCKKYRLGKDGDKFTEKFKTILRNRVIVDTDFVAQSNGSTSTSGILYEIDEAATAERDEMVNQKPEKIDEAATAEKPKNKHKDIV